MIASVVDRGKERASEEPSLIVKLSITIPILSETNCLQPCHGLKSLNAKVERMEGLDP